MDFNFDSLEYAETGEEIKETVTIGQKEWLMSVLNNKTTFEPRQKEVLNIEIKYCEDVDEYYNLRKCILMNQIEDKDKIAFGFTYNMSDINAAIRYMNCTARKIKLVKIDRD